MDRQSLGGTLFDALLLDHAHDEHDLKRPTARCGSKGSAADLFAQSRVGVVLDASRKGTHLARA
jgi:hypothetical protein